MKIIASDPMLHTYRGGPVKIGNVYTNPHGKPHFKIVLGIVNQINHRPFKNVALLKILATGEIAGCAMEPEKYVQDHQDLIGIVEEMPTLKIKWLRKECKDDTP
jgi:hypothetical protein